MIHPNKQVSSLESCRGPGSGQLLRDQSYSLTNSSHSISSDITMGTDKSYSKNNAPSNKMTITKKHSHHSHSNRPRSKSWDQHRHSPIHKKKHSKSSHKHSPSHQHHGGRVSPKMSPSSMYRGKMWIRPVAVRVAPSLSSKETQVDNQGVSNHGFRSISASNKSPSRQVTSSPTYDDDEIMLMEDALPSSSFDSYENYGRATSPITSPKKMPIIFGESGKPIKPRRHSAFGLHHALTPIR